MRFLVSEGPLNLDVVRSGKKLLESVGTRGDFAAGTKPSFFSHGSIIIAANKRLTLPPRMGASC